MSRVAGGDSVTAMPEQDLIISVDRRGEARILRLDGAAGLRAIPQLDLAVHRLLADRPGRIVVDARRLEFIATAGVGSLLSLARSLAARGARLEIAGVTPSVRELLVRCGVGDLLLISEAIDPALT